MTLKEQIMKLQTYKMYEGEDTVYVERDDVLKVLGQQPCEDWKFYYNHGYAQAKRALEQQPCEDECITKAEVINTIHKTIYGFFDIADDNSEEPINDKDKLLLTINKAISNAVKALPSVTPSRPRGKWEVEHKSTDGYTLCVCSNCKDYYTMTHYEMKYCPNCGAKMEVEE